MVAEGPAVKMFDRLQHDMIEDDLELLSRVVGHAVEAGRLPADALRRWTFAPLRRRWRSATGCETPRPTRFWFATGRCRRRRWPCVTAWIRARRGKPAVWTGNSEKGLERPATACYTIRRFT